MITAFTTREHEKCAFNICSWSLVLSLIKNLAKIQIVGDKVKT